MSGEPSLQGFRVLVVEDDYLLAYDAESALTSAGAEVVGPFARESGAMEAVAKGGLSAAVTDVNLGFGPSFETAHALRTANVPFVFLTGYDQSVIPAEFADVPRLVKPIYTRQIVREVARLLLKVLKVETSSAD